MFLNDDLAVNQNKFVSYVTKVTVFHKHYKADCNLLQKIYRTMFGINIPLLYKYTIRLGVGSGIFGENDVVSIKHHNLKIDMLSPDRKKMWLESEDWTNINIDIKDIKMIILNDRTYEL
jgi:hypothetical protein